MIVESLNTLNNFSYSVLMLSVVIAIKALLTHFIKHEPLRFFQIYCQLLSNKVNNPQNSNKQQSIAGLVAIFITLAPIVIILWLFEDFVEVDYLWQGLLLYFALGAFGLGQTTKTIAQTLTAKQKYLAKQTLTPLVLRDTEHLSAMGLTKACIEMQLLRTLQQTYVVSFIFLITGPLVALTYRLLLEMHYCWNDKQVLFKSFGKHSKNLVNLLQWLPIRIFSFLLLLSALGKNLMLFWHLSRPFWFQLNSNVATLLFALNLAVRLGGVAMYNKAKLRKVSFNDLARQPEPRDIICSNAKIKQMLWLNYIIIVTIATTLALV
ncbi:MAG: cobalamin biosynthesis protein [Colwellia sp.]